MVSEWADLVEADKDSDADLSWLLKAGQVGAKGLRSILEGLTSEERVALDMLVADINTVPNGTTKAKILTAFLIGRAIGLKESKGD